MGFRLNNRHSSELNLEVRSVTRPILPNVRQTQVDIPGKDGTYDFSDNTLEDRIIEVECAWVFNDFKDMRKNAHKIASFLYSNNYSSLIFDDEPDIYYLAKVHNKIDLEQTAKIASFVLQFRCKPLGFSLKPKIASFNINSSQTILVQNVGTYTALPLIYLTANINCSNIIISHDFGVFEWKGKSLISGHTLKIDCEYMTVTDNGLNALNHQFGEFIKLSEGFNSITVTNFNGAIRFEYTERWL